MSHRYKGITGTRLIAPIVWTLLSHGVNLAIYRSSVELIIPLGLRGYRLIQGAATVLSIAATLWFLVTLGLWIIQKIKDRPVKIPTEDPVVNEGMLSASGKLSDEYVLGSMVRQGTGKWRGIRDDVQRVTDQLILMNSYQERLSHLLANNNAGALSDAEGILEKVEQQILGNVRKILNYMEVLGVEDEDAIVGYLESCEKDNERLLNSTKTFLISVTGYLNEQGEDSAKSLKMLEEFQAILAGEETFGQEQQSSDGFELKL